MLDKIYEYAKSILTSSWWSHDIDHTLRVRDLCLKIWKNENADIEILEIAALLHDIWRPMEFESKWKICHAEYWAQLAKAFLQKNWYNKEKIDQIVYCISTHRSKKWDKPDTLEAKILFDADKLDSIWAVWIWRAFMYAEQIWSKLHNEKWICIENTKEYTKDDTAYREYILKLKNVKNRLYTKTWKEIAEKRHKIMELFFNELLDEIRYCQ